MQRALALLLLTLFNAPLISPYLRPGAARELPPCCRRNGKHHCAMAPADAQPSNGTQLNATCPLFPQAQGLPYSPLTKAFVGPRYSTGVRLASFTISAAPRLSPVDRSLGAAYQRGPPSYLE